MTACGMRRGRLAQRALLRMLADRLVDQVAVQRVVDLKRATCHLSPSPPSSRRASASCVRWRIPPPKAPTLPESGYSQISTGIIVLTER